MTSNQSDECIAYLPGGGIGSLNGMMFNFFGGGGGGGGGGWGAWQFEEGSPLCPHCWMKSCLRSTGQFHTFYCKCMNTVNAKVIVACHPLMFVAPQGFLLFSLMI